MPPKGSARRFPSSLCGLVVENPLHNKHEPMPSAGAATFSTISCERRACIPIGAFEAHIGDAQKQKLNCAEVAVPLQLGLQADTATGTTAILPAGPPMACLGVLQIAAAGSMRLAHSTCTARPGSSCSCMRRRGVLRVRGGAHKWQCTS